MKQTSSLARSLASAQERHAEARREATRSRTAAQEIQERHAGVQRHREREVTPVLFRLYTESFANLRERTAHYFDGAMFLSGIGLWQGVTENATIIEIIGTMADEPNVRLLARDIREANHQSSVLVTWQRLDGRLDVQA